MKKTIFLLFLLSGFSTSYAQYKDFGPIGAKWTYEVTNYNWGVFYGGRHGFETIESVKDTMFQAKKCHMLVRHKDDSLRAYSDYLTDTFFTYTDTSNGKVYFAFNRNHFFVLYNFGGNFKDSNYVKLVSDSSFYKIESKDTVIISSQKIIDISIRFFSFGELWAFHGDTYEKIGNLQYMLPQYDDPSDNSEDDHAFRLLRCYEDLQISYKNDSDYYGQKYFDASWPCDTVYNSARVGIVYAENEGINVSAYPNPFTDNIRISMPESTQNVSISILDADGRLLFSEICNHQSLVTIPTDNFKSGIYILHISTDAANITRKLIK